MFRRILSSVLVTLCAAAPAAAQGRGHAYGLLKSSGAVAPPSGGAVQLQPGASGVRTFGSWLDDASVMTPGSGALSVSFGWYRSPVFHELDVPIADGGIGLTRRVQFGFSVPYYHVNEPGGPVVRGVGDLYLSSKVQVREPSEAHHGFGLAVIPIVEVLSSEPGPDGNRFNWAMPVSLELQRDGWRAFGSAGYFSRGSVFASGAIEASLSSSVSITGTLTQSHSTADDDPGAALVLSRTRTDVSAGATYAAAPGVWLFGSVGRTLSRQDANAASVVVSGGVSFLFDAWHAGTARK